MKIEELLQQLHDYSKVERYLKEHREIRNDKKLIKAFNENLSKEEAEEVLVPVLNHLYPDSEDGLDTLPEDFFFKEDDRLKVKITQHTRYSTPVTHKHDFYEMFYVYEGEFEQLIDNKSYTMRTGDLCLIPPGIYHSMDVNNYSVVLNILIQKDTFQEIFFNNLIGDHAFATFFLSDFYSKSINTFIIFQTKGDLKVKNQILEMYLEIENQESYYPQVVHSTLVLLFSHLLRTYGETAIMPKPKRKQELIDFEIITMIDENYKIITLENLAEKFHYSPQHISLRVKQITGESFSKYLQRKRLAVAADLLKHTNMKIKDVGANVGYQNQENFIRSFKRYYHSTPSGFRKEHNSFK